MGMKTLSPRVMADTLYAVYDHFRFTVDLELKSSMSIDQLGDHGLDCSSYSFYCVNVWELTQ